MSQIDLEKLKQEIPVKIGLRIRSLRIHKGLTQTELANLIASDRQYMYKIESGRVSVSIVKLAIIAAAMKVSLSELTEIK